jgi:hypothetical protein
MMKLNIDLQNGTTQVGYYTDENNKEDKGRTK